MLCGLLLSLASPTRAAEDALPPDASSAGELLDRVFRNLYEADFVQVVSLTTRSASGRTKDSSVRPRRAEI
jgi:hypothetical protein